MPEMFLLFGLLIFIGTAFHEPISDLLHAFADWVRSKSKRR